MAQRDIYHHAVKQALINDGWTITHDPYPVTYVDRRAYIDLGAERIAAEKGSERIAVEVKSFIGPSAMADIEQALGQYLLSRSWMSRTDPTRLLYLAIEEQVAQTIFAEPGIQILIADYNLRVLVVNAQREEVTQWIS